MGQAAFCGKATVDGTPCRNGPGCTATHPPVGPIPGARVGPSAWPLPASDPLDEGLAARVAAAADPATGPVALAVFAGDTCPDLVRFAALANPSTPTGVIDETVEELFGTGGIPEEHLAPIAANPSVGPDTLLWLSEAEHPESVRVAAVRNPSMPVQAVVALAQDDDQCDPDAQNATGVRSAAAGRIAPLRPPPYTNSAADAARYAADPDPARRYTAATAPGLGPVSLGVLAADPDHAIRYLIGRRSDCPAEILERLAGDPDIRVAKAVASNPRAAGALARLASHPASSVRAAVAKNPVVPVDLLERLAGDPSAGPRRAAANSPAAPPETLAVLAVDPDADVREAAVANPNCPAPARAAAGLLLD